MFCFLLFSTQKPSSVYLKEELHELVAELPVADVAEDAGECRVLLLIDRRRGSVLKGRSVSRYVTSTAGDKKVTTRLPFLFAWRGLSATGMPFEIFSSTRRA